MELVPVHDNMKKIKNKWKLISIVAIVAVIALSAFIGISYAQGQIFVKEQNAYLQGVEDAQIAIANNMIEQLNSQGYVSLGVQTENGLQNVILVPRNNG